MIDQDKRITELVASALKKVSLGEEVGYSVGPCFAPMQLPNGQQAVIYSWIISVTMRSPLLGEPNIAYQAIIPCEPGRFPPDKAFTDSVKMAMDGVRKIYDDILSKSKDAVNVIPGQLELGH